MQTAMKKPALVLALIVLSGGGCEKKPEPADQSSAASEGAPMLDAGARDTAIGLITDDLNRPFSELQLKLAEAAYDGVIGLNELWLPSVGDAAWWYWSHGFAMIAPGGSSMTLTPKGQQFIDDAPPVWLRAEPVGSPTMSCESAGSLTSAACTASVQYEMHGVSGTEMAQVSLPATTAHLEASFSPAAGWSVSNVSVEGDVPHDAVRALLFGESSNASTSKARFDAELTSAASAPQLPEAPEAEVPVAAERAQSATTATSPNPKAQVASPSSPPPDRAPTVISSPVWSRVPTAQEMRAVYPVAARSRNLSGRSDLDCGVTPEGVLTSCTATGEFPPGSRFGQAGVAATRYYTLSPQQVTPPGSRVRFSISWSPQ